MRRVWVMLASGVAAMGLSSCGGGGDSRPDTTEPGPAAQLRMSAAADDAGRAPGGVVHTHRVELRNAGNASARAVVVTVSPDAQALQLPLSCESSGCTQRNDGGVEIAEIAAGSTVVLRQQLRIKPGYRGAVRNDWQASATGSSVSWRQELTAYTADLAVSVGEPDAASIHEVRLTNQGPDEATEVNWELLPVPGQTWRIAGCSASTGSTCPAALAESMTVARLPAGASLRLQVEVEAAADPRSQGIASRAAAAGDPDPGNDMARHGQSGLRHLFMTDLEGRPYRLSIGITSPLRVTAQGVDYRADFAVDVTGQGLLGTYGQVEPLWGRGTVNFWGPVMVLGLDISGVRKPYLAPRQPVTRLSELEGAAFNVLGSRADANGKPTAAYSGSARFKDGALQLCLPDAPTPFEQCPAAQLTRFEAALVGSEIELVSRDRVMRLRAARSGDGPILVASMRDATTGRSEFWMGLPSGAAYPFRGTDATLHETTFESASGHSMAALGELGSDPSRRPQLIATPRGLPSSVLLALNNGGKLGICGLSAQFDTTPQPGLFQGLLQGDWLPGSLADGQFLKEKPCFGGAVHHTQTYDMAVLLGAQGGPLMGRWMFVGG